MSNQILMADGSWRDDAWRVVRPAPGAGAAADDDVAPGAILPLARFLALPPAARSGLAVWLAPADDPALLLPASAALELIAVDFPTFRDGRGYSAATLLRARYGFAGELRAIGDVLVDQLFALKRVGFTSFGLRADQQPAAALAALRTFSETYQRAVDQPLPLFARRAGGAVPR
jgi:uncharacterized protein (DUF934 family)